MQRLPVRSWRQPARPHFYWQGTLIVLPALLLAATGLHALRQDRALAQHQAAEEAGRLAGELAERWPREVLAPGLPDGSGLEKWRAAPGAAADDPIVRLDRGAVPSVGCFVGEEGRMLYPEMLGAAPEAVPLDAEELTPEQRREWSALLAGWNDPTKTPPIADRLAAFTALKPPPRFAAVAQMRTAAIQARAGLESEPVLLLRAAIEQAGEAPGESGYPLRLFAELQMLPLLPERQRGPAADALCGGAVVRASRLAPALLERAGETAPSARAWQPVFAAHERARELWREVDASPRAPRIFVHGEEHVALAAPRPGGRWFLAVSPAQLRQAATLLSGVKPPHFGVSMSLGGTPLTESAAAEKPLARAERRIALAGGGELPLTVQVFLEKPDRFFAQQRARSVRFGALIAAAAAAVLAGFFAAWRAFRRQQLLSEMKTNFVSSVSHELRAPIASVRLMAEELDGGAAAGGEKLQQYHRFIVQECRRLSAVIENVLDFSRREQGREEFEFEPTDLARLVEESVALMRIYGAEKGLALRVEITGEPAPIEADGRALQRLLVNLLDNAIKHSPEQGAITVALDFTAAATATLSVEDHGPGIPREEHARIFERFYRLGSELRRETQGVGLGLSIVKHVAAVHGGRVLVRSEVGKGSRFSVELPRAQTARAVTGNGSRR